MCFFLVPVAEFEPEPCPKWQPLSELLTQDIPGDMRRRRGAAHLEAPKVLILCQDSRTCYQLKQYLTQGGARFLLQQAMQHEVPVGKLSERLSRDTQATAMAEAGKETGKTVKSKIKEEPASQQQQPPPLDELSQLLSDATDVEAQLQQQQLFEESYMLTMTQAALQTEEPAGADGGDANASVFEIIPELERFDVSAALEAHRQPCICLQTFKTEREGAMALEHMLEQLQPHYVIMYNTNVTAIRQLEVFEARRRRASAAERMKIYFLIHARTVEEQSYLTSLRREKAAFELIINTKSVSCLSVSLIP